MTSTLLSASAATSVASTSTQLATSQSSNANKSNCIYSTASSYQKQLMCIKFVPQAFNTNKCQQCFNFKDLHSAEALAEFSKSNRKVCKYGYLFIAPPDLELNKTKRWQWRFFIFYDDSELTYSLDENPLTLPQGRINISKCEDIIELSNKNDLSHSGYPNALCLKFATPNKDIYIAAGNYEEMAKWRDVLMFHCTRHMSVNCSNSLKGYQKLAQHGTNTNQGHNQRYCHQTDGDEEPIFDEDMDEVTIENQINCYVDENVNDIDDEAENETNKRRSSNGDEAKMKANCNSSTKSKNDFYSLANVKSKNYKNSKAYDTTTDDKSQSLNDTQSKTSTCGDVNQQTDSTSPTNTNKLGSNEDSRRLSYKEDDLLRKQRLKENLNQLLIEYKHEEEAQLKKYSKFTSNSNINSTSGINKPVSNRTSLDSCYSSLSKFSNNSNNNTTSNYSNSSAKNSAFSLIQPNQVITNSAFRPINSHHQSHQKQSQNNKTSQNTLNKTSHSSSSSSSWSSTFSSSPSSSTSSSSNSPPKTRSLNNNNNSVVNEASNDSKLNNNEQVVSTSTSQQIYKKPCLISPRKSGQQPNMSNNSESNLQNSKSNSLAINDQDYNKNENQNGSIINNNPNGNNLTSSMSSSTSSACSSSSSSSSLTIQVRNSSIDAESALDTSNKTAAKIEQQSDSTHSSKDTVDSVKQVNKNDIIDLTQMSQNNRRGNSSTTTNGLAICSNLSGYLWKTINENNTSSAASLENVVVVDNNNLYQFEKHWFSLNTNTCSLVYWNDKYDQDLGKLPLGKYELNKCCQIIKDPFGNQQHNHYNSNELTFKLIFHHQNQIMSALILRSPSKENKTSWCEAIKNTIDNYSSCCNKCKPKLVVNPMQLVQNSSVSSIISSNATSDNNESTSSLIQDEDQVVIVNTKKTCPKISSNTSTRATHSPSRQPSMSVKQMQKSVDSSNSNDATSTQFQMQHQFESLKLKHDKLLQENQELNTKFKLLEQIHLNTINEYEKQQNRLFNQMEDMHLKNNKSENEVESLNKKLAQTKQSYDVSLHQIQTLNENLSKQKDQMMQQEKEMERMYIKMQQIQNTNDNLTHLNEILNNCETKINEEFSSSMVNKQPAAMRGWNKEVKSLDSRISDVLSKLKERETNLKHLKTQSTQTTQLLYCSEENLKQKCEKLEYQLQDAQSKLKECKSKLAPSSNAISLNDFSDDLGKVLMSKEEVITQLETKLKDKEKQIQMLTSQLNEEILQTNKYQDAFNLELNRNTQLNNEIKILNDSLNQQYFNTNEIELLKDELGKSQALVQSLEFNLNQSTSDKEKLDRELKSLQEYSKNEMEILQEEIKTFEYKLVHSQRQAQEYQSILEDMDFSNTNAVSYLSQTLTMSGGSLNSIAISSNDNSSLQNRLKRTQSYVQLLIQQIIQIKNDNVDDLTKKLNQLQIEFNEIKEENIDLNDHIYSIDVYMREKEAQCDQYQKEKEDLEFKLSQCSTNNERQICLDESYNSFLNSLLFNLNDKTKNFSDFVKFILKICNYFLIKLKQQKQRYQQESANRKVELEYFDLGVEEENNFIDFLSTINIKDENVLNEFKRVFSHSNYELTISLNEMKNILKQLLKFISSSGLQKFNQQILSYMAEQLIHKAALNGNLKFACELLRKKFNSDSNLENGSIISQASSSNISSQSVAINSTTVSTFKNEQDEKIFKLASELLLSDQDALHKLSAQVLNEAQHLNQLNCVLTSLKKLRWKNLSYVNNKKSLNEIFSKLKDQLSEMDAIMSDNDEDEEDENCENKDEDLSKLINDLNEDIGLMSLSDENECNDEENKTGNTKCVNYILDIIKNVFNEHKNLVEKQLNEVHKLMSISSDDDLLSHLQNENLSLQQEISKLKQQISAKNKLTTLTATSETKKANENWINNTTDQLSNTKLRKFGTTTSSVQNRNENKSAGNEHHYILTDLLSQDDTLC